LRRQTDIQAKQHAVGRLQLLAIYRPKLRIKHVSLTSNLFEEEKKPIAVSVTIINDGPADAHIIEYGMKLFVEEKSEMLPPIHKYNPLKKVVGGALVLTPGQSTDIFKDEGDGTIAFNPYAIGRGDLRLYCTGYVHYADSVGNVRTTAFCRVLHLAWEQKSWADTGRFRLFRDPDYEYES
jgi:hypothetical protein